MQAILDFMITLDAILWMTIVCVWKITVISLFIFLSIMFLTGAVDRLKELYHDCAG